MTKKTNAKSTKQSATKQSRATSTSQNKKTKTSTKTTRSSSTTKKTSKNTAPRLSAEKRKTKINNSERDTQLVKIIVEGMQEKKANRITILDLTQIENSFCNYFVICEAESKPQLQAITESVEEFTRKKLSTKPHHTEGLQNAEWILLDYLTVVAHIFRSDIRQYYKLEDLWADAQIQHIN